MSAVRLAPTVQSFDSSFPSDSQPGGPLPQFASCDYHNFYGGIAYCRFGDFFSASYDYTAHKIECIYHSQGFNGLTVGDLILAWGQPTGIEFSGYSTTLYWGNKLAYVSYNHKFTPSSLVTFTAWCNDQRHGSPWRGFQTKPN